MVSERQKSRPEPPRGPGCGEVGGRPARAPTGPARPRHRRFRTGPRWAQLRREEVRAARRGEPRRRRRTVTERSEDEPARGPAIRTGPAGPGLRSGEARAAGRGDPRRRRRALAERRRAGRGPAREGQPIFVPEGQNSTEPQSSPAPTTPGDPTASAPGCGPPCWACRALRGRWQSSASEALPHAGRGRRADAPVQQGSRGRAARGCRWLKSQTKRASSARQCGSGHAKAREGSLTRRNNN